jgi:hypothetical protein
VVCTGPNFKKKEEKSDRKDFFCLYLSQTKTVKKRIICRTVRDSSRNNINDLAAGQHSSYQLLVKSPQQRGHCGHDRQRRHAEQERQQ